MLFIAGCEKDQSTYFYVTVDGYQWIGEPHKFVPTQDRLSLTVETKNNYYRSINIRINSFHGEGNYTISNPTFGDYIDWRDLAVNKYKFARAKNVTQYINTQNNIMDMLF